MHTLHFAKNWHVSTEAQLILNKFQVYKILRVRINIVEKKENNVQNRNKILYFILCICNFEGNSDMRLFSAVKGAVLMSTRNLCFEQKCETYQNFLPENFQFFGGEIFNIFE